MARYKHDDYAQMKLVRVSFEQQILPGTFEHTLSELIDGPCIDPTQRLGICVHTHPFPYSDLCFYIGRPGTGTAAMPYPSADRELESVDPRRGSAE